MHEYLFPVPGRVLRGLLECKARSGEAFSRDEATLDVLLALDREARGDAPLKPYRYLARRWKWSYSRVQRSMNTLKNTARDWRSFFHSSNHNESRRHHVEPDSPPPGLPFDDSESQPNPDESLVQQYRTDTETDIHTLSPPRAGSIFLKNLREGMDEASSAPVDEPAGYTIEEVRREAARVALDEVEAEKFFWHYENAGWHRVRNLPAALHKWKLYGYSFRTRSALRPSVDGGIPEDGLYAGAYPPARAGVRGRAPERGARGGSSGGRPGTRYFDETVRKPVEDFPAFWPHVDDPGLYVLTPDPKGGGKFVRTRYIEPADTLRPPGRS